MHTKTAIRHAALAAAAILCGTTAQAERWHPSGPVVVNPHVATSGYVGWESKYGFEPPTFDSWSLTPAYDQWVVLKLKQDDYIPGDNYALFLNGVDLPWDAYVPGTGGVEGGTYAEGEVKFLLQAGTTHALTFVATPCVDSECHDGGVARYWITPVPEPGTYALVLGGLGALAWRQRRRGTGPADR